MNRHENGSPAYISREAVALKKARSIVSGDFFYHTTEVDNVKTILSHGLISPNYADCLGIAVKPVFPGISSPNHVYLYVSSDEPKDNRIYLTIPASTIGVTSAVIVMKRDGLATQPGDPPGNPDFYFLEERMAKDYVPTTNIIGVVISQLNPFVIPLITKEAEAIIHGIKQASMLTPSKAVPLYDQQGNMLWPQEKSRWEFMREALAAHERGEI